MNTENKNQSVNPEERVAPNQQKENKGIKENAINKTATDAEKLNHQEVSKQEKHQPRDRA